MSKTVFILGAPRSGTSLLLYMLVRNQPAICGSNLESKFYSIANQRPFQLTTFTNDDYFKSLLSEQEINSIYCRSDNSIDFFRKVIEFKLAQNNCNVFVEKSPIHTLFFENLIRDFKNVSFLLIYRNAAANIHSIATTKWIDLPCDKFPGILKNSNSVRYFFALLLYYKYWRVCKKVEKLNETVLVVNYENIVLEKEDIKKQLEDVLEVDLQPLYISRPFSSEVTHKSAGFDKMRVSDYQLKMPKKIQKMAQLIFEPNNKLDSIVSKMVIKLFLSPIIFISEIFKK